MIMPLDSGAIMEKAKVFGVDFLGFAHARTFLAYKQEELSDWEDSFALYNWVNTIIVIGVPMLLPVLETYPSVWGLDQEHILTHILEKSAGRIIALLTIHGERAAIYPLSETDLAIAGYFAGLGSIGDNWRLLTADYGPRVKLAAIASSFVTHDTRAGTDTVRMECLHCGNCKKICPANAFGEGGIVACAEYEKSLAGDFRNPCAACLKVCPIGADRVLYKSNDITKYFNEGECKAWTHIRSYGSYPITTSTKIKEE
jgi:epoxyqueuosine reductase QueG